MTTPRVLPQYKKGDTSPSGYVVEFVFGNSDSAVVFKDAQEVVHYETAGAHLTPVERSVLQRYDQIHARLGATIPAGKKRTHIRDELATALFRGLSEPDGQIALKEFDFVAARLAQEVHSEGRFTYLTAASITVAVVVAVWLLINFTTAKGGDPRFFAQGAMLAAVGAWVSVQLRARKLELGPYETPAHLRFEGVTRILLGLAFGVFALWAVKSGQFFPGFLGNPSGVAFIALISGVSERLIPDIISKFEGHDHTKRFTDTPKG